MYRKLIAAKKDQERDNWTCWNGLDIVQTLASLRRLEKLLYAISLTYPMHCKLKPLSMSSKQLLNQYNPEFE